MQTVGKDGVGREQEEFRALWKCLSLSGVLQSCQPDESSQNTQVTSGIKNTDYKQTTLTNGMFSHVGIL